MTTPSYVYVWRYQVRPDRIADFERVYGPDGEWIALFRQASGYHSTRLLHDRDHTGWFMTVDTWESAAAFDAFRHAYSDEFDALDRQCEHLTLSETFVGRFQDIGPVLDNVAEDVA